MRKLMWMGIGFAGACLIGTYLLSGIWLLVAGLCLLALFIVLLIMFKEVSLKRAMAFLCLGASLGSIWFQTYSMIRLTPALERDGTVQYLVSEVTDYSCGTANGIAVDASVQLSGMKYTARLYLEEELSLTPGDRVSGNFRICYTGPGGGSEKEHYSASGLLLICYGRENISVKAAENTSLSHVPAVMRKNILEKLEAIFPGDTVSFVKALLLGTREDLDYATEATLTLSGIVHLISVSGLHISVLMTVLYVLLGKNRVLTPVIGIGFLVFVAALTGFTASVVRSCLMNGLVLLALMADREADPPTALAFSVIVMLAVNPLSAASIGLQLSAASVFGILAFSGFIYDRIYGILFWADARTGTFLAKLRNAVAGSVSVSLSATVVTAPLTAIHFGTVSLVGVLTNLLTVSVANALFVLLILTTILGFLWLPAAKVFGWCLAWAVRYILAVAKLLGSVPLAAVYTESIYIILWLIFCIAMVIAFAFLEKKKLWQLLCAAVCSLAVAIACSWAEPRTDSFRVTVLDVGQGQCVIVHSENKTYMIDCGGEYAKTAADKAAALLNSQGIFRLDGLILTHYDYDHVGAVPYLLQRVPAQRVYLPDEAGGEEWVGSIGKLCEQVEIVEKEVSVSWSGAELKIYPSSLRDTSNESSLCILFQKENYDILITGDRTSLGEVDLLQRYHIGRLDALVVGHHGSDSSTGEYLIRQTLPGLALISVGKDNRYGHPAPSVVELLERYGCAIRRTDREGTIVIRR